MVASNSVFISYRRSVGFPWARLVWEDLVEHGHDAFLDLESLQDAGHFDRKILNQIAARPYFLPVLVPGSLQRCRDPDDWLRRELDYAVATDRAIVPLIVDGFDFSEIDECLSEATATALRTSNGVGLVAEYFADGMRRLREDRLKPIELETLTLTDDDHDFAAEARRRASATTAALPPPVPPPPPAPAGPAIAGADPAPVIPPLTGPATTPVPPVGDEPPAGPEVQEPDRGGASRSRRTVIAALVAAAVVVVSLIGVAALRSGGGGAAGPVEPSEPSQDITGATEAVTDATDSTDDTTSEVTTSAPDPDDAVLGEAIAEDNGLDERLVHGDVLRSLTGGHELQLTSEGALLATTDGDPWEQQPADRDDRTFYTGDYWKMQGDGNLVLYEDGGSDTVDGDAQWDSGVPDVAPQSGDEVELTIFDDAGTGVLQITVDDEVVWTCRSNECPVEDDVVFTVPETEPEDTDPPTTTDAAIEVPVLIGLPREEAAALLRELGLEVGEVPEFGSSPPLGIVLDQSIDAGTPVEPGTTVEILVSASRDRFPTRETVPEDEQVLDPG